MAKSKKTKKSIIKPKVEKKKVMVKEKIVVKEKLFQCPNCREYLEEIKTLEYKCRHCGKGYSGDVTRIPPRK